MFPRRACIPIHKIHLIAFPYSKMSLNHLLLFQVLHYLQTVNFSMKWGETVFFDSQGDPPARYELVNLQKVTKGTMEVATIGYYDATQPQGQQFTMNPVNIIWGGGLKSVRASVQINFQIKTC